MLIKTVFDFNKVLAEQGPYTWPGGYPTYFITSDGAALSWQAVVDNQTLIRDSIISSPCGNNGYCTDGDGWRVICIDVNWEDDDLYCEHIGNKIESAYGANIGDLG